MAHSWPALKDLVQGVYTSLVQGDIHPLCVCGGCKCESDSLSEHYLLCSCNECCSLLKSFKGFSVLLVNII